jgi:uncharacterized protein YbaR (Trm112 family)
MLAREVLDLLRCPATGQPLRPATGQELEIASAYSAEPLIAGLVTVDGALLYPVRTGIPILLKAEAVQISGHTVQEKGGFSGRRESSFAEP